MKPQKKGRRKGVCHLEQKLNKFWVWLARGNLFPLFKEKGPYPFTLD